MYLKVTLLLLAWAALGYAQLLSNPVRVYSNPTDGTVIKSVGAAMTTCSVTLVIMDNSTQCIKYADADGVVYDWACTPEEATAFDMFIYASAGYIINPEGQLVIIDMYTGDAIDTIGPAQTKALKPWKLGLYTSFAVPTLTHTWFMADGATNSTIYLPSWTITSTGANTYSSNLIVQLTNTQPIKCLFTPAGGIFMVVYEGGNTIFVYSWTAATSSPAQKYLYNITGFGEIGACGGDYYNRGWIWDKGCNCLKIIVTQGTNNWVVQQSISLPELSNPINIQPTRNAVFFHDDNGVMRYDLPALGATFTPPADATCTTTNSATRAAVTWGSPPYTVRVLPDIVSATSGNIIPSFTYNYTGNVRYRAPYTQVFHLYDDDIAPEFQALATSGTMSTTSATIPPYAGTSSWSMLMAQGYQYGIGVSTSVPGATISAGFFQTLELMVNPGSGLAGKFRIDMTSGSNFFYFDYLPSDLPANTWTKISIDLRFAPMTSWTRIVFADYSGSDSTTSFLYVDNIFLIPYDNTRVLAVKDFCNATVFSTPFPINGNNLLSASISSQSTSCNAADAAGQPDKTSDGSLTAVASGGTAPYKYAWSFSAANTSTVSGLSAMGTANIVYDNAVSSAFTDLSSGLYSLSDTTYFRSAPYSASLVPEGITSDLTFFTPAGISATTYSAVEFWVHGGPTGNQLIYAGLISNQFDLLNPSLLHRLMAIPSIPANTWTKVTYPISASAGTFYGFVLRAIAGTVQPTIYFDDIRFVNSALQSTVTDATNCAITNYVSVGSPSPINVVPTVKNLKCFNGASGSIALDVSGGTGPYTYSWDPSSQSGSSAENLGESFYTITVTDSNGCAPPATTLEVIQPAPINVTTQTTNPQCYGGNGTATVRATGGSPLYTYAWTSPSGAQFAVQPRPAPLAIFTDSFHLYGSFSLSTRGNVSIACDGQGGAYAAQSGYCAVLVVPPASSATLLSIGCPKCIDFSQYSTLTFWINLIDSARIPLLTAEFVTDGTPVWRTAVTTATSTPGWQKVTVALPSSGSADSFALVQDAANAGAFLIDTIELVPVFAMSSGSNVASGFDSVIEGAAGQYVLEITDGNSCPTAVNVQITQPAALNATFTYTLPKPLKKSNGAVQATISGGVPPYTYYWPDVQGSTATINNVPLGPYILIVTDANGCVLNATAALGGEFLGSASVLFPSLFAVLAAIAVLFL